MNMATESPRTHAFSGGMDTSRRAKIVATLGPSCSTLPVFRELVRAGLDVARLNFSHGSHEQKAELIRMVRQVSREENKPICILADLQGPKIRTGKLKDHKPVLLVAGKKLTITPRQIEGTAAMVGTVFTTLAENLEPGSRILLSDGLIELRVSQIKGDDVVCEIVNGGMLGEKKGINLPGIPVKVPSLTEKDEEDLIFAIGQGVDTVAVSFVRTADDVRHVKAPAGGAELGCVGDCEAGEAAGDRAPGLDSRGGGRHHGGARRPGRGGAAGEGAGDPEAHHQARGGVPQAGDYGDADAGVDDRKPAADAGGSVGRGQRDLRRHGRGDAFGRDGGGQVSGGSGGDDGEDRERDGAADPPRSARRCRGCGGRPKLTVAETICECMAHSAEDLDVAAIAIFTESGTTVRLLSKYRPEPPIYALSPYEKVINRSMMLWGTYPILCERFRDTDKLVDMAEQILEERGYVQQRQVVGIVAGTRTKSGATNFMRLHMVGDGDRESTPLPEKTGKKKKGKKK